MRNAFDATTKCAGAILETTTLSAVIAVGEHGAMEWHPAGNEGESHGDAGEAGASSTIWRSPNIDWTELAEADVDMPAMWSPVPAPPHANPLVTGMEITIDTAASRPVSRRDVRIIVSIYRLRWTTKGHSLLFSRGASRKS